MERPKVKNMEELAVFSGISRPTLSKYFNNPGSVRTSTRAQIEDSLNRCDYSPNIFAMNQNRKLTRNIGIIVPYLADPFFAEIVRNIEQTCLEAGFWPILFSSHGEQELENNALASLRGLRPAGALIAPLGRASDLETIVRFANDIPTIVFDSNLEVGQVFVGSDNFHNTELMVDYLCQTGEPPCFLEMPPVNPNARRRRKAFCEAMERRNLTPEIIRVGKHSWDFEQVGLTEGKRLIAERKLPSDTVLCSNDRIAIGLIAAAYQQGLRVGAGPGCALRIAGHDGHPWSEFTTPPLTTVSQDYTGIARRSVDALFDMIETGGSPKAERQTTLLKGELIKRQSA